MCASLVLVLCLDCTRWRLPVPGPREETRLQKQISMTHSAGESFRRNIHTHTGLIVCVSVLML